MGFFGSNRPKNTLAMRVRRAEAKAKKIQKRKELEARLKKAQATISKR